MFLGVFGSPWESASYCRKMTIFGVFGTPIFGVCGYPYRIDFLCIFWTSVFVSLLCLCFGVCFCVSFCIRILNHFFESRGDPLFRSKLTFYCCFLFFRVYMYKVHVLNHVVRCTCFLVDIRNYGDGSHMGVYTNLRGWAPFCKGFGWGGVLEYWKRVYETTWF